MGELIKAKQCFEMALQSSPDRTRAMIGLGLIAEKNGDVPEAVRWYGRALAVQPDDVVSLLLAHALQQEGHVDEAKEISERASRFSSDFPEALKAAQELLSGK
jgi:tetratricopeptide (TPR) repeat protein